MCLTLQNEQNPDHARRWLRHKSKRSQWSHVGHGPRMLVVFGQCDRSVEAGDFVRPGREPCWEKLC